MISTAGKPFDPDQAQQNKRPDQDPNCLVL